MDKYRGLTSEEVGERIAMYGYNGESRQLDTVGDFKPLRVLFSFRFFMMFAASLALMLGGHTGGGFVMLGLAAGYSAIETVKGYKCRDAFKELRRISSIRFRVLRDGQISLLRKEYIVPDDIIILQEGESVPADAYLLEAHGVSVDESVFTGDRAPAVKRVGTDLKNELKQTCIYKGTRMLSGNAVARVNATGVDSRKFRELGETPETDSYITSIEAAAGKSKPVFSAMSCAVLLMYFIIAIFRQGAALTFANFPETILLPAFSFALCLLAAECSTLVRAHYLYGAFNLLKRNCVVKDLNAMAGLSAITAICVDKTGVIIKNHTSVVDRYTTDEETLARISALSCDPEDSSPMDRAIILEAAFGSVDVKALRENELVCRYPFSEETKLGGNLWRIGGALLLCVKGSPELILTKCDLPHDYLFSVQKKQEKYAEQGHRVVAVAYARVTDEENLPRSASELNYTFVGLLAFANQTRDSAPAAVRSCYRAGVKVIMTTGDSADAALTIGRKIGLNDATAITGEYLEECYQEGKNPKIKNVNIFARVTPDKKSHIIDLLQREGEIVAVTGIGAADVEALERADVGVALPQETSGAAKEACGLVLADDDFNSIVDALKETRQIHHNIKQTLGTAIIAITAMAMFALYCLFSNAALTLSPVAVSLPSVLITPLLSLAFFRNRADIKSAMTASGFVGRGALDKRFLLRAVTQGLCASLAVLVFRFFLAGAGGGALNACFIAALTGALSGAVFVNLSASTPFYRLFNDKNLPAFVVMGAALLLIILLIYIPGLNAAFGLAFINPLLFLGAVVLGIASQFWVEIPKIRDEQINKKAKRE